MLRYGYLKRMPVVSLCSLVFAIAILGLFGSCNNPFVKDLGEKVVIGDARIFNVSPVAASFLHRQEVIIGEAWAHRDLHRVEVRIVGDRFAEKGIRVPEPDEWIDITVPGLGGKITKTFVPGEGINARWSFTLDTLNFLGGNVALPDGRIRIQFRAVDNVGPSEVIETVYTVKNEPSAISFSFPRDDRILEVNDKGPALIPSGLEIRGDVVDLLGLAPGYPKIQIWPEEVGQPDGIDWNADHEDYGWVSMFLFAPGSMPAINDEGAAGTYDWRLQKDTSDPIGVNFANFTFRMSRFRLGERRDDGVVPAEFPGGGLGSGYYYFRIITKDREGVVGHFPPLNHGNDPDDPDPDKRPNPFMPGSPVAIRVTENFDPPVLRLDNGDRTAEQLAALPNLYITEVTSRKIAIDDEAGSPYLRPDRAIFRLRTLATHDDGVGGASLRWEHPATGRGGTLDLDCWDGESGTSMGVPVPSGRPDDRRAVHFTFTADGRHRDIFTTHLGAYVLTLTVSTLIQHEGMDLNTDATRSFNLFMDGEGPRVEIRPSFRGAVVLPGGDARVMHGGFVNENPITVNGNVQVSIDRSAAFAIQTDPQDLHGRQMVKWFAEPIPPGGGFDFDNPPQGSMLAKLVRFRRNPSPGNLEFFHGIGETADSGWVAAPMAGQDLHEAYRTHNFKFNAGRYNGRELWLYVIAMDGVNNLGFAMQKIEVDEGTDVPAVSLPGLSKVNASGDPIGGIEGFELPMDEVQRRFGVSVDENGNLVPGNNWMPPMPGEPGSPRRNILQRNQGIEFILYDDDGIAWDSAHIDIGLSDLNIGEPWPISIASGKVRPAGTPREWMATLSQAVMAEALGHGSHLRDGFYYLDIKVRDSHAYKVEMEGIDPVQRSFDTQYYFAVHTTAPEISVTYPINDSLQPGYPESVHIDGTVRSRFPLQRLWISFAPHVLHGQPGALGESLKLGDPVLVDGMYTYRWTKEGVALNPYPIPGATAQAAELRNFSLRAFDSLAFDASLPHRVQVDALPPEISLVSFDQLRPITMEGGRALHEVWGNVHFRINVTDIHRLDIEAVESPVGRQRLGVWWWLIPQADDPSQWSWDTPPIRDGMGGRFYFFPEASQAPHTEFNVVLDAVFDSQLLSDREYKLFVMARDNAGNWNEKVLVENIRVNEAADLPGLDTGRLSPATPPGDETLVLRPDHNGLLQIRGIARDTDGFFGGRVNQYVQIRFSVDGTNWGDWIGYPHVTASLDPTGAVSFSFNFYDGGFGNHVPHGLRGDGLVRYQIRVTDEQSFTVDTESGNAATILGDALATRNKNPQLGLVGRFNTTNTFYPHVFPSPVSQLSRVFPLDNANDPRGYFSFIFDATPPVIEFDHTPETTLTFSNVDALMAALRGTIREAQLRSFSISLGSDKFVDLMEYGDLDSKEPGVYDWNLVRIRDRILEWWGGLGQGSVNVMLVATDRAGNIGRGSWNFIRDTQGPNISFTNISRAIGHSPYTGQFPDDWPGDWPHGTIGSGGTVSHGWHSWPAAFRYAIADWPSDFAFLSPSAVRARIELEGGRSPTVITEPEIRGNFDDMLGFIFPEQNGSADFYFRIPGMGRKDRCLADCDCWNSLKVWHDQSTGRSLSSASWNIALDGLEDGPNTLDIRISDTAGNWTELFGLRFVLDMEAPRFFATRSEGGTYDWFMPDPNDIAPDRNHFMADTSGNDGFAPMPEHARVFSAADVDANSNNAAFRLQGRVRDANLRNLSARIISGGQEVASDIANCFDSPEAFDGDSRLSLRRLYDDDPKADPHVWEWTLDISEGDVYAMRAMHSSDSTRRLVSLVATDIANRRSATVEWPFYLDGTQPTIEFHNLQVVDESRPEHNVFNPRHPVLLEGSVRDDTGIRAVEFVIARLHYPTGEWRFFDGNDFTLNDDDTDSDAWHWHSALDTGGKLAEPSAIWRVNQDRLTAAGYGNIFRLEGEGQYQIYVRATDWSLARNGEILGNPAIAGGFSRRFFIDSGPPDISWEAASNDSNRLFANNDNLLFTFKVRDANTVPKGMFAALVRNANGETVASTLTGNGNIVGSIDISFTGDDSDTAMRTVTLRPNIGHLGPENDGGIFTLVLTVRDATGSASYIGNTRTFTFDRVPPAFDEPPSLIRRPAQPGDKPALAGRVTISGTTQERHSSIHSVEYALVPQPLDGSPDFASLSWRTGRWMEGAHEVIRMEDNPSDSWTVEIANTRNITQPKGAWTQTLRDRYAPPRPAAGTNLSWGGTEAQPTPIADDGIVHQLRLAIRATDAAGNVNHAFWDYWIYPEGDNPSLAILSPDPRDVALNLQSGRFTISGTATDNEHVSAVAFRVLRVNPDGTPGLPYTNLLVPEFRYIDGTWLPQAGSSQWPRSTPEDVVNPNPPAGSSDPNGGWYRAGGGGGSNVFWSVSVNDAGELNYAGVRGTNDVIIEVVALDATRLDPIADWDAGNPLASRVGTTRATVVTGAPEFSPIHIATSRVPNGGTLEQIQVGRHSGDTATIRFGIRHETGLSAIRFQETAWAGLPGAPNASAPNFNPMVEVTNLLFEPDGTPRPFDTPIFFVDGAISIMVAAPLHTIPEDGLPYDTWNLTVEIDMNEFRKVYAWSNDRALRFPLFISAADDSRPSPLVSSAELWLPIDNTAPTARHEHNSIIAGTSATLGGGSAAGPIGESAGTPGAVDRVIVWFQQRGSANNSDGGRPWFWDLPANWESELEAGRPVNPPSPGFQWGEWVPVSNAPESIVGRPANNDGHIRLPLIGTGTTVPDASSSAIVIDRNDPMGSRVHHGHRLAMDWVPGGMGQQWGFTFNSMMLPSGPMDMHYVVFDRAGNATWFVQPIVVMNFAPRIDQVQVATALHDSGIINTLTSTGNRSDLDIFRQLGDFYAGSRTSADPEENDIRSGISPLVRPPTQARLLMNSGPAGLGARHHFANFTARHNLVALAVNTLQRPGPQVANRTFAVQYVAGETPIGGGAIRDPVNGIRAGNVYLVENASDVDWRMLGTQQLVARGYAFLAVNDGADLPVTPGLAQASVRRLDPHGSVSVDDQVWNKDFASPANSDRRAEFAYRGSGSFGGGGIRDSEEALFIVRVFDGPETDRFGDFTLLSLRVNNEDGTRPFAQLYDLNPLAENLGRGDLDDSVPAAIAPMSIGANRTRGGLWRDNFHGNLSRPGHIEPRRIPLGNGAYTHSLSPMQMGQDLNDPERVNIDAFFEVDTVSGRVVLRGYAEDDQRIGGVVLEFADALTGALHGPRLPILIPDKGTPTVETRTPDIMPARTGLLQAANGNVRFTDTVDLFRHRVEWAFVWDTANFHENFVVGNLVVRAIAVNYTRDPSTVVSGTLPMDNSLSSLLSVGVNANTGTASDVRGAGVTERSQLAMRNFGFPANMQMYNSIRVNLRPYITGFVREQNFNNTRSLQGRYAFFRGGVDGQENETALVSGYNLGGGNATNTNIFLPGGPLNGTPAAAVTSADFALPASPSAKRFRQFTLPQSAITGDGIVSLAVSGFYAVNTGGERPGNAGWGARPGVMNGDWWVQPWNVERSTNAEGSQLWDNVTRVHVWQSNDTTTNHNQGSFPITRPGWAGSIFGTAMSINPITGELHASHNEAGANGIGSGGIPNMGNNVGITVKSTNELTSRTIVDTAAGFPTADFRVVTGWLDPIINSSIAVDARGSPWVVSSNIGRAAALQTWRDLGGVWVHGPGGARMNWTVGGGNNPNAFNESLYHVESTWYNASTQTSTGWANGWSPTSGNFNQTDQFRNPRIATFTDAGDVTHAHVAYFDSKDGSIKYRIIRQGPMTDWSNLRHGMWGAGTDVPSGHTADDVLRGWVNLDGGFDADDTVALADTWPFSNDAAYHAVTPVGGNSVPMNGRVFNHAGRDPQTHPSGPRTRTRGSIIAGEHNDIAVTSQGYPVIAYFDATNERLRLAVSNSRTPFDASRWSIITDVLAGDPRSFGTGQYVSIRIDTVGGADIVHISAWNSNFNSLVYIRGRVNTAAVVGTNDAAAVNPTGLWTLEAARFIDTVGSVGRRSAISLDEQGNPWIAYLDTAFVGGREGVKVAFLDNRPDRGTRGADRSQTDLFGDDTTGWETMHVPARFQVVDHMDFVHSSRLGMENWPTRNFAGITMPPSGARWWRGAVGFLSNDLFRIAYWVE